MTGGVVEVLGISGRTSVLSISRLREPLAQIGLELRWASEKQ